MRAMKGRGNLYLYLTLTCFFAIVAIFVIDGYLGVYDTLYITVQERVQEIEPDYWQQHRAEESGYRIGIEWGESVHFRYEIDNRTFSAYPANVKASVWKSDEEIIQLLDENVSVAPFEGVTVDWVLQPETLEEAGFEAGEYTVKIKHGDVERKIVLSHHYPVKVPLPLPR